ncbi:MAG: hypothetical protein QY314_01540 [Candidatus Dojkabacteria bacterium]|nr:MAG: hypothetical protein QY314_01540 [Candidatus Dojkabacteria bacterium]
MESEYDDDIFSSDSLSPIADTTEATAVTTQPSQQAENSGSTDEYRIFGNTRDVAPALVEAIGSAGSQIARGIAGEKVYVDHPSSVRRLALVAMMTGLTAAAITVDTVELTGRAVIAGAKRLWNALKGDDGTKEEVIPQKYQSEGESNAPQRRLRLTETLV